MNNRSLGLLTSSAGSGGGGEYWALGCVTDDGAIMLVSGSESQAIEVAAPSAQASNETHAVAMRLIESLS